MDKHNAWQREFTLLLKLFSQWLKSRSLRTDSLLEGIARLHYMAQREPAPLVLLASNQTLRLRFLEAVCRQTAPSTQTLTAEALAWSGLRTWTFDASLPISVQIDTNTLKSVAPATASNAALEGRDSGAIWHPSDATAMAEALEAARALVAQYSRHVSSASMVQARSVAPGQSLEDIESSSNPGVSHCHINVHHAAFYQELRIHECPVKRLRSDELKAIAQLSQSAQHYLWLIDAANFNPELETEIFISLLRESLKKGKILWLAVYQADSAHSKNAQTDVRNTIDADVKEWALGLGLTPANIVSLNGHGDALLEVGRVVDLIQKNIIMARRIRWRTDMHAHIGQLHHQVAAQLSAHEAAHQIETKKAVAQWKTQNALIEKVCRAAAARKQHLQNSSEALHVVREAQLKLRSKVWAALDNVNAVFGSTRSPAVTHTLKHPEQLKKQLLEWFAAAQQSLDSTAALLRAGASVLVPEIQKLCVEEPAVELLPQLPDVRQQLTRLRQYQFRVSEKTVQWQSLTLTEAYEQTRVAQIALDSIVETTRAMVTQWFGQVLLVIDRHIQAIAAMQAQVAHSAGQARNTQEPSPYPIDAGYSEGLQIQKTKLDEQIALLNATVMDALALTGEPNDLPRLSHGNIRPAKSTVATLQPIRSAIA